MNNKGYPLRIKFIEGDNEKNSKLYKVIMIGKRLKLARINVEMTQAELGVKAGLDEESVSSRISSYENEVHQPDFGLVCRLADVLDVPTAYFYAREDDLADLIIQYHRLKKQKPNAFIGLTAL